MTVALETCLLDPERDAMGLIDLFEHVFGATVSPAMWYWKYVPPWATRYYCWVARDGDRVVGYVGAVPLRGIVDGREMPFFQLADAMVHPEYRRKYDYFDLGAKHLLEDLQQSVPRQVVYGFSEHIAFLWLKRRGYCDLIEKATTNYVRAEHPSPGRFGIEDWQWAEAPLDACWLDHSDRVAIGLIRDGQYVRWRYGDHPVNGYRLLGVTEGGVAVGWVVVGNDRPGERGRLNEIPVVDMFLPPGVEREVLGDLRAHLGHDVAAWLPVRLGAAFEERNETKTNVYQFIKNSSVATADLQQGLFYTMGDVDWW